MCLSELLIPCLIGHKIQALRFRGGAGQNNQSSSVMSGVEWSGASNFDSTAPRKLPAEVYWFKACLNEQEIMRNCLDWAKCLIVKKNFRKTKS